MYDYLSLEGIKTLFDEELPRLAPGFVFIDNYDFILSLVETGGSMTKRDKDEKERMFVQKFREGI